MSVMDYASSFDGQTRKLRQPLSQVYKRFWSMQPLPLNNSQNNTCQNKTANEFLAESFVDCMFLRLPQPHAEFTDADRRREEWLRGNGDFWPTISAVQNGTLGSRVETRSQYLQLLEKTLSIASNIRHWAIAHVDTGFIATQEIVEAVGRSAVSRPSIPKIFPS